MDETDLAFEQVFFVGVGENALLAERAREGLVGRADDEAVFYMLDARPALAADYDFVGVRRDNAYVGVLEHYAEQLRVAVLSYRFAAHRGRDAVEHVHQQLPHPVAVVFLSGGERGFALRAHGLRGARGNEVSVYRLREVVRSARGSEIVGKREKRRGELFPRLVDGGKQRGVAGAHFLRETGRVELELFAPLPAAYAPKVDVVLEQRGLLDADSGEAGLREVGHILVVHSARRRTDGEEHQPHQRLEAHVAARIYEVRDAVKLEFDLRGAPARFEVAGDDRDIAVAAALLGGQAAYLGGDVTHFVVRIGGGVNGYAFAAFDVGLTRIKLAFKQRHSRRFKLVVIGQHRRFADSDSVGAREAAEAFRHTRDGIELLADVRTARRSGERDDAQGALAYYALYHLLLLRSEADEAVEVDRAAGEEIEAVEYLAERGQLVRRIEKAAADKALVFADDKRRVAHLSAQGIGKPLAFGRRKERVRRNAVYLQLVRGLGDADGEARIVRVLAEERQRIRAVADGAVDERRFAHSVYVIAGKPARDEHHLFDKAGEAQHFDAETARLGVVFDKLFFVGKRALLGHDDICHLVLLRLRDGASQRRVGLSGAGSAGDEFKHTRSPFRYVLQKQTAGHAVCFNVYYRASLFKEAHRGFGR